jgi:cellobionic acid phosphorylase
MEGMEHLNQYGYTKDGRRYEWHDLLSIPNADTFLWNQKMLFHVTVHGFAQSQFMQPEPSFYSYAPLRSENAAMAPEPQYFDHHPGRFFYIKNEIDGATYSAPFRPMNVVPDAFTFSPGRSDVRWKIEKYGICTELQCALPCGTDIVELWRIRITNTTHHQKNISVYPYFPVGFPSWMNTEGAYDERIGGMLAYTLTPYRKLKDYYMIKRLKNFTYLLADHKEDAWEANLQVFEGNGGLRDPVGIRKERLSCTEAAHETAACIMQYRLSLSPGASEEINFLFGPANNCEEILNIKAKYLIPDAMERVVAEYEAFYDRFTGCMEVKTKDETLNNFLNVWLPRQALYHAYTLRMVTDPQTRNLIQDAMSMIYIEPAKAKELYLIGLTQQKSSGEMPDGILLTTDAKFKYTNQVPHTDHNVWWAFAVLAYCEETGDFNFLSEQVPFYDTREMASVYEHICRGLEWLASNRSERGLCFIGQGDWNDPMNMVGYKGKGESVWLTQAMVYAMRICIPVCEKYADTARSEKFRSIMNNVNTVLNSLCWDGEWYARGFTDDGVPIGVKDNAEGKIFLNTQSFGLLSGAPDEKRIKAIIEAVAQWMSTPFGLVILAPSYSHMNENIGRLTQKHPSTAENGSVYCHANVFYAYALLKYGYGDKAYDILRRLIPGPDETDLRRREHLPLYLPNYYRGPFNPRVCGKASHLMNTGSLVWFYRCFVEEIFGLRGTEQGLLVQPCMPKALRGTVLNRRFRGKMLHVCYHSLANTTKTTLILNGKILSSALIPDEELQSENELIVHLPD